MKGFDPTESNRWYQIKQQEVFSVAEGRAILYNYGGSLQKALLNAYPDIHWDLSRFPSHFRGSLSLFD